MRAGLSTVQQTLTPEAATILNDAIAEACRRGHGQTTPLHVAATLLAAPGSHLRQACIRSHPNSSHPLQCRALELCFSVALDRIPTAQGLAPGTEPPISNALMAALKRAQAHQRRGCPEQQQQPLLAVKVELEQLIVSILDDPSVSRVMREASFSSPAVKATIEQSINMANSSHSSISLNSSMGFRLGSGPAHSYLGSLSSRASNSHSFERDDASSRILRNSYLSPRFSSAAESNRNQDVRQIMETFLKVKKRNPVLIGENEAYAVLNEFVQKIEKGDAPEQLRGLQILPLEPEISSLCSEDRDKDHVTERFKELDQRIEEFSKNGVIINVGDLKWLVEQPRAAGAGQPPIGLSGSTSSVMQQVVMKVGNLLSKYRASGRLWLIGIATCETYLRCLVYHPSMEVEWDLQTISIVSKLSSGFYPRISCNPMDSPSPFKGITPFSSIPKRSYEGSCSHTKISCCSQCIASYEQELALLEEEKKVSSVSSKSIEEGQPSLATWFSSPVNGFTAADPWQAKNKDPPWNKKVEDLQKKWNEKCSSLHHHFHSFRPLSSTDQTQESSRLPRQVIGMNGKEQTDTSLEKSAQNQYPIEKCFPISLAASSWGSLNPSKCVSSNFAQSAGAAAALESLTRTSASPISVNGQLTPFQSTRTGLPYSSTASHVTTDLALGSSSLAKTSASDLHVIEEKKLQNESHKEQSKDSTACLSSNIDLAWRITPRISPLCNDVHSQGSKQSTPEKQSKKDSGLYQPLLDPDELKNIYRLFEEKVSWQPEAGCSVASVAIQHKSKTSKRRGLSSRGDLWLLFLGPDRVGKRKMAAALSEVLCGSEKKLITFKLGSQDSRTSPSWSRGYNENDERGFSSRGKTILDKITETVRQSRMSVLLFEDVDQADQLTRTSLVRAMEKGRLSDSYGRDIDLGRMVFVMTASGGSCSQSGKVKEVKFTEDGVAASQNWPMQIRVENARFEVLLSKPKRVSIIDPVEQESKDDDPVSLCLGIGNKRKADCMKNKASEKDSESVKKIKEPLISLDLNLSVEEIEPLDCSTITQGQTDPCQGSRDSSDLTVEQGLKCSVELVKDSSHLFDETVEFKSFDFDAMADKIVEAMTTRFHDAIGSDGLLEIDKRAMEQMLAFSWYNSDGLKLLENWLGQVLEQSLREVSTTCVVSADTVVKLVVDKSSYSQDRTPGVCLPCSIPVNRRTRPNQTAGTV
eukprot:TRINITY_DN9363_c0_g1_i1.p1 TRINITY_DN9363_c0_g1~~TRINITY_DN9363_c0_g1_i1.p1  ORF type:complete len:1205 (-),score=207.83 TRINITY_DN9363_c0_g1_i1:794-4408(-)